MFYELYQKKLRNQELLKMWPVNRGYFSQAPDPPAGV